MLISNVFPLAVDAGRINMLKSVQKPCEWKLRSSEYCALLTRKICYSDKWLTVSR